MNENLKIEILPSLQEIHKENDYDIDRIIYDLNEQISLLSSTTDNLDYIISAASGMLCAMLDILWIGEFDLVRGKEIAEDEVDKFVKQTAKVMGYEGNDISEAVNFLEKRFPLAADGNTRDFGGGKYHHLNDFSHHPTIIGLIFSLLTQFTCYTYGTKNGLFTVAKIPETHLKFIGKDVPSKIIYGTIIWFFHLVSDIAGSSSTAGKTRGTGIPGPILALAKEISGLPIFKSLESNNDSLNNFITKLFDGRYFEKDLKFDFRAELGIGVELGRQAIPVIANECIVRSFYSIRRFAIELKDNDVRSFSDIKNINWNKVKPTDNPTIARMLTISTGVFTTVDISEAIISQKYFVSINYIGVGRFAIAIGEDVSWALKRKNLTNLKEMYENIQRFVHDKTDENIYQRIGENMNIDKFGLTVEQTEILYNIEYLKTLNDIKNTKTASIASLKREWLNEWKEYMSKGFTHFLELDNIIIHWYTEEDLYKKILENSPEKVWFRLVLLEVMLFEPYYPLSTEKDKKGNEIPSKKYKELTNPINGYKKNISDEYLETSFCGVYCTKDYIRRLRKCYKSVMLELSEILKTMITSLSITAGIALIIVATAGAFAPSIAVALVGSHFAGLHGAALTGACLAYLGGGAIAFGGAGMAGGTIAIVGGGAALGIGLGASVGGAVGATDLIGKRNTILQSAKLLVAVREVFLNDEKDLEYSTSIYEKYVKSISELEKSLVDLRLQADVASAEEKKKLKEKIKTLQETVDAMKLARKSMIKFKSSFEEGLKKSNQE